MVRFLFQIIYRRLFIGIRPVQANVKIVRKLGVFRINDREPPCRRIICRAMLNPIPDPDSFVVKKGIKI